LLNHSQARRPSNAVNDMQLAPETRAEPVTTSSLISLNTMLAIALVLLLMLSVGMFIMIWRAGRRLAETSRRLDDMAGQSAIANSKRRRRLSRRLEHE
jgi:hypothetical protein